MRDINKSTRSVVKECDLKHSREKVWRALTQRQLIEERLMEGDFTAEPGHRFELNAEWGTVSCEVLAVEQNESLSYSWEAHGLESIVTWTLTETETGTRLRMEQTGFRPDQDLAYRGAIAGWDRFLDKLEQVVADLNHAAEQGSAR